jgi:dephospho-CoA kinase
MVSETAKSLGIQIISMGDVIREEAESRGLAKTPATLGALMLQLRKEEGDYVVAKRCLGKIKHSPGSVLIEGVRSIDEVNYFKANSEICLIAVHASPKTRYKRLVKRGRPDDPKEWKTFEERDLRELGVGLGTVIALADKLFINEGTVNELSKAVKTFFRSDDGWK